MIPGGNYVGTPKNAINIKLVIIAILLVSDVAPYVVQFAVPESPSF